MTARLTNTVPGDSLDPIKPGQPVHLGLKSVDGEVVAGTARVDIGLTGLVHAGVFPDQDASLIDKEATVTLETSEHRRPVVGTAQRTLAGSSLVLTKLINDLGELAVYETKIRIKKGASLLARIKLKRKTWQTYSPDWVTLSGMTGVYVGLEHGTYNTCANVFLRDNAGAGELVLAGPLQAYNAVRPGQNTVPFDWPSLAVDSQFEIFIFINTVGKASPFSPAYTPVVEVWTKSPLDVVPVSRMVSVLGSLGTFPGENSNLSNSRVAPDDVAVLYFGNIGRSGDVLQVDDWELYPDYRQSVIEGEPLPNHEFLLTPDAPAFFRSTSGALPTDVTPGRWFKYPLGTSLEPAQSFYYQPGKKSEPLYTSLSKDSFGYMALHKEEPRLELRSAGVMVEAFLAGNASTKNGQALGMGIGIDDGQKSFRACLLDDDSIRTIGLLKDGGQLGSFSGYHLPVDGGSTRPIDFRSLKLVRLVVDRARGKVSLFVEDENFPILTQNLVDQFPSSPDSIGRVFFGHIDQVVSVGKFDLAFLNYVISYLAWEGLDGLKPDDLGLSASTRFTEILVGAGSTVIDPLDDSIVITKEDFLSVGSKRLYTKSENITHEGGVYLDFRVKVDSYSDHLGQQNAPKTDVGVGLRLYFGNKVLHVGLYDCGIHGKKIAVLPGGSGSLNDILEQTSLGRDYSADADFSSYETYRVFYKAFGSIEIWSGTTKNRPIITIPWANDTDGFLLPLDTTPPALEFGHFEEFSSSKSRWQFIRWGRSNGYDTAVVQQYPEGMPKYLFGGRSLVITEFEDTPSAGADVTAPLFGGASGVVALSTTALRISWSPATDDFAAQSALVYDIWLSTTLGGENFLNPPSFTTGPGATYFDVTGLTPSTPYYFVVRARDQDGNRDTNVVEVTGTTDTPADITPPVFAGITGLVVANATTLTASWVAATDNVTAQGSIVYDVWVSTTTGGQNFGAAPYATSAPGATNVSLTGLTTGQEVFVVVRARDAAGNRDSNVVELSATPAAIPAWPEFTWASGPSLGGNRWEHFQHRLLDGRVVLFGGLSDYSAFFAVLTTKIFTSDGSTVSDGGNSASSHIFGGSCLLLDGTVLAVGGYAGGTEILDVETFNPSTNLWTSQSPLPYERDHFTLTALNDGTALMVGGKTDFANSVPPGFDLTTNKTFIYSAGSWTETGPMLVNRRDHVAVKLANGDVLVAGGNTTNSGSSGTSTSEIYQVSSGTWASAGTMSQIIGIPFSATLLPNGKVLVVGLNAISQPRAEIYDPGLNSWTTVTASAVARYSIPPAVDAHLLVGPYTNPGPFVLCATVGDSNTPNDIVQAYDVTNDNWRTLNPLPATLTSSRVTQLSNGNILVTGGENGVSVVSTTFVGTKA